MSLVEFDALLGEKLKFAETDDTSAPKKSSSWIKSWFNAEDNNDDENIEDQKTTSKQNETSYWMSDASVNACYNCSKLFTTLRRKHHCRFCGQIFCWKCAPIRSFPINKRCCDSCQEAQLVNQRKTKSKPVISTSQTFRNRSLSKDFEDFESIPVGFNSFEEVEIELLFESLRNEVFETGKTSLSGEEVIKKLKEKTTNPDLKAKRMVEQGFLLGPSEFSIDAIYKFYKEETLSGDPLLSRQASAEIPIRSPSSSISSQQLLDDAIGDLREDYYGDSGENINSKESKDNCLTCISNIYSDMVSEKMKTVSVYRQVSSRSNSSGCEEWSRSISDFHRRHFESMVSKLLSVLPEDVSKKWSGNLIDIVPQITSHISSDSISAAFDVRKRIHVKKIISDDVGHISKLDGVVFSGKLITLFNNAKKRVKTQRENVTIVLLDCMIDFRMGGKGRLESLDELIRQEQEFLDLCCKRILDRKPDVILSSKSICNYALDFFNRHGDTQVVLNVKEQALKRLSIATGSDIISNLEELKTSKIGLTPRFEEKLVYGADSIFFIENEIPKSFVSLLISSDDLVQIDFIKDVIMFLCLCVHQMSMEVHLLNSFTLDKSAPPKRREFSCNCADVTGRFSTDYQRVPTKTTNDQNGLLFELSSTPVQQAFNTDNSEFIRCGYHTYLIGRGGQDPLQEWIKRCNMSVREEMIKPHRFEIPDPEETCYHEASDPDAILDYEDREDLMASFRATGSYPSTRIAIQQKSNAVLPGIMARSTVHDLKPLVEPFPILFSTFYLRQGSVLTSYCTAPVEISLDPYSPTDSSIADFVENLIGKFSADKPCKACNRPERYHIKRLIFGEKGIHIIAKDLPVPNPTHQILMWSNASGTNTPISPINEKIANMSMAYFIKILTAPAFMPPQLSRIENSSIYFANKNMMCALKLVTFSQFFVKLPSIAFHEDQATYPIVPIKNDLDFVSHEGQNVLNELNKQLKEAVQELSAITVNNFDYEDISQFYNEERTRFENVVANTSRELENLGDLISWQTSAKFFSKVSEIGQTLIGIIQMWNIRIQVKFDSIRKSSTDEQNQPVSQDLESYEEISSEALEASDSDKKVNREEQFVSSPIIFLQKLFYNNVHTVVSPFRGSIHYLLQHSSPYKVTVREEEPSSALAFALSSANEPFAQRVDRDLIIHAEASTVSLKVKVLNHAEFAQLRKTIGLTEDDFIQSLIRCEQWKTSGGKSGATWFRTLDKRFLIKQIKEKEMATVESFGLKYIQNVIERVENRQPSAMVKVYAAFRVSLRTHARSIGSRTDFVVMEDLFWNMPMISKTFDLKGSQRNRMSKESIENSVLLDSNYISSMCHSPIHLNSAAHLVLMKALENDVEFLSRSQIIDYSLLIGIDYKNNHLVVGLIDYLRTYTWDKYVESKLKSSVSTAAPTIISPENYKTRFMSAMKRYFLRSPEINQNEYSFA